MANRNKDYDEILAKKFDNLKYAQTYLLHIVESESLSVTEALRETIKAMGLKRFAVKSELSIQAVSGFVNQRQSWSTDKIAKHIFQVFKLKTRLVLEKSRSGQVA
jgi:hypothetical protein